MRRANAGHDRGEEQRTNKKDVSSLLSCDAARLVKLPTHTPEDILNGNHKQLRDGKGNAAHQETTNFIYCLFGMDKIISLYFHVLCLI